MCGHGRDGGPQGAQDAAREKDLWVSSRHCQSHSHFEGEMFRQCLKSILNANVNEDWPQEWFKNNNGENVKYVFLFLFILLFSTLNFVS